MIHKLMDETSIESDKAKGNYFLNNGYVCSFEKESFLTDKTKQDVNKFMLDTMSNALIQKFSRTCAIN